MAVNPVPKDLALVRFHYALDRYAELKVLSSLGFKRDALGPNYLGDYSTSLENQCSEIMAAARMVIRSEAR